MVDRGVDWFVFEVDGGVGGRGVEYVFFLVDYELLVWVVVVVVVDGEGGYFFGGEFEELVGEFVVLWEFDFDVVFEDVC